MPKIRDYSAPETDLNLPEVRSNSDLNPRGMGQIVSGIGDTVEKAGDILYRRKAQEELSNLNADFAEARADWTTRIEDGVRNGSVDSEKLGQSFDEEISKLSENATTNQAQNFFNKQSGRLKAFVLKTAARGQAAVAGARAEGSWKSSLALNSSSLDSDPSNFSDVYQSSIEAIDSQVAAGSIPATAAEKFKYQTGQILAESAVRGWAKLSPDIAEKKLDKGEYDKYFNGEEKAQMRNYINAQRSAKETEERRADASQKRAEKANEDAWMAKNLGDMVSGSLKTQDIMDAPISAQAKIKTMKMYDQTFREQNFQNPRIKAKVTEDIINGKITDVQDLFPYVNHGISITDVQQMKGFIDNTPAGQRLNADRKSVLAIAKGPGGILVKDFANLMTGPTAESQSQLHQWLTDVKDREDSVKKEGKDVHKVLYDPRSTEYVGSPNFLKKYQGPIQTSLDLQAKTKAGVIDENGNPTTSAGVHSAGEDKSYYEKNPNMWRPNDTLKTFLSRKGSK